MKTIFNILLTIIAFVALVCGIFYAANNGKMNKQMKHVFQYYLMLNGVDAKIIDFKLYDGVITSSQTIIKISNSTSVINDLKIQANISGKWNNPIIKSSINLGNVEIFNNNQDQISSFKVNGNFVYNLFQSDKNYNVKLENINMGKLEGGDAFYEYNSQKNYLNASINFDKLTNFKVVSDKAIKDQVNIEAKNIPLTLYKLANNIVPKNGLLVFLNDFIKSGYITNGKVSWNTKKEISAKTLFGKINIADLDISYNEDLPRVTDMDVVVDINGKLVNFYINKAYTSNILLSDGLLKMDWKGVDNTILTIDAKGEGEATGLTGFIPESQHKLMNKANIDLKKITGKVDANVEIKIPLKKGTQNTYNITANLPNSSLSIFKNNARLTNANISGFFDGEQVALSGVGKINNFHSELDFVYNIEDESQFNHKLDIKTHIKPDLKKQIHDKIAFVTLLKGESIVNLEYQNKDSKGFLKVDSDISNLDLYFDKLGIHKTQNENATLSMNGIFNDPTTGSIDFSMIGDDNFKINGNTEIDDGKFIFNIKEIKNRKTNLSSTIFVKDDFISIDLKGKTLDLSEADMMQFLEKEKDGGAIRLMLDIDKIQLKNNITIDDFRMMLECDKNRCHSGYIDTKIEDRLLEALLSLDGDNEKWIIRCGNAGSLLKGLDTYDSMKSGNLVLNITTSRKEVKPGEIIPIHEGTFSFEHFVLKDNPMMVRLISFVSVPGFINFILGKKDISFSIMNGQFNFKNNILTIESSSANGPYFDFTLRGNIDAKNKTLDVKGHVVPGLYGISYAIGNIPIIGKIFTGTPKNRGLFTKKYKIKDNY